MKAKTLKISTEARAAIRDSLIMVGKVFPPDRQLDKKVYAEYKKIMQALEGTWQMSKSGKSFFDFPFHVQLQRVLRNAIKTGEIPLRVQTYQEFFTPSDLADGIARMAIGQLAMDCTLSNTAHVLEPSAGRGAIVEALRERSDVPWDWAITAIEIQPMNVAAIARDPHVSTVTGNFLDQIPTHSYDAVLMNPPFTRDAWLEHLEHAIKFLKNKGFLIAVVPSTATLSKLTFITDKSNVCIVPVPQFSFEGTDAKVSILTIGIPYEVVMLYFGAKKETAKPKLKARITTPELCIKSIRERLTKSLAELDALEQELQSKEEVLVANRSRIKETIAEIFRLYGEAIKHDGKLPLDHVKAVVADVFALYRLEPGNASTTEIKLCTICQWAVAQGLATKYEAEHLMAAYD